MNSFAVYLLQSGVSLALLYSVYWLFLRKDTFFVLNRLFLLGSIALSLVLPAIDFSGVVHKLLPSYRTVADSSTAALSAAQQVQSIAIGDILWSVYLTGAVLLSLRFLLQLTKLSLLVKRSGVRRQNGFAVVISESIRTPFSFFNLLFMNDKYLSEPNYRRIVAHESIHMRQLHSLDLILVELLSISQWFNPFVWTIRKALKETHEFLADDGVLAQGFNTAQYQRLIFEQLIGVKLFEFANNFNDSTIKRRLEMMTKTKSTYLGKLKVVACLPVLFLLVVAFTPPSHQSAADDALSAQSAQPQKPAQTKEALKKKELEQKKEMEKKNGELKKAFEAKAKELSATLKKVDQKLADESLPVSEREVLLKKKQEIENTLKKQKQMLLEQENGEKLVKKKTKPGSAPPPPPPQD